MALNHFSNSKGEPNQSQARPKFDWPALGKAIFLYRFACGHPRASLDELVALRMSGWQKSKAGRRQCLEDG